MFPDAGSTLRLIKLHLEQDMGPVNVLMNEKVYVLDIGIFFDIFQCVNL